ncbi:MULTISPECIES: hypothetical protein [unclassified Bradyrhizobium]
MTVLTIDYRLTGAGWADCIIRADEGDCKLSASYLSDALGRLVLAASAVLVGTHSVAIGFDVEPGEYRWSVVRTDGNTVRIVILRFFDLWSNLPDTDGTPLLSVSCAPREFGKAVQAAAEAVLKKHGLADYKERWGHDFPSQELDLLRSYIAAWDSDAL